MSSHPHPLFEPGKLVGDYLLDDMIVKGSYTSTWEATQVSVQRKVILCILDAKHNASTEIRDKFIADVRAKGSVHHPLIASVLEAVNEGPMCYFAVEKLKGEQLATLHEDETKISPLHAARIIHNISGAFIHLEAKNLASVALSPHDLYIDEDFHCRMTNTAISGRPDEATSTQDKEMLGELIQDLVEQGETGSSRTNALLGYMAEIDTKSPITWQVIHSLVGEIERQLAKPGEHGQIRSDTMRLNAKSLRYKYLSIGPVKIALVCIILLIAAALIYQLASRFSQPEKHELQDMVSIPGGKYAGPEGYYIEIPDFKIDAHEVTIGEYAEFLDMLEELEEEMRAAFQHKDQPAEKTSHTPDDWENLYAAAKSGGTWNNQSVDLYYPVVGVDWWDAYAYAQWRDRDLPPYDKWYAACSAGSDPERLVAAGWNPVDQTEKTSHGVYGLAGNVSEWIGNKTLDPADPFSEPRYMTCGASYLRPQFGARTREWVDDRSLRRPDLGFRTYLKLPKKK